MKNKLKIKFFFIIFYYLIFASYVKANEPFEFNVAEVEIVENGNVFLGKKGGTASTESGVIISADNFRYDKLKNILYANGSVKVVHNTKDIIIYTENITYIKNDEIIFTTNKSKAVSNGVTLDADDFKYNIISNIIIADGNVKIQDTINDYIAEADYVTYYKNLEKIITIGETKSFIKSKYNFDSSNVTILRDEKKILSSEQSKIIDTDLTQYDFSNYVYFFEDEFLKAKNINIISNNSLPASEADRAKFSNGFFDLKNKNFDTADTLVKIKKNTFDNSDNDPRILGVSSEKNGEILNVKKAVFTSCELNEDKCPPWSISAEKITHDKKKKQLIYDKAFMKFYDKPVMYFPKFFHPDPTVERQSGLLKPQLNNSEILGSSIFLPYFHVISESRDFTFKPTIFEKDILMLQGEYRQENANSSFIADVNLVNGYKSSTSNKKNNLTHFFSKYEKNLNLKNYIKSYFSLIVEKTNNDTYLKVFDSNLIDIDKSIKPANYSLMKTALKLELDSEDYNFTAGMDVYENLTINKSSDKYQYVLPYYNFSKNLYANNFGTLSLDSDGSNKLSNTNNLRSRIINNFDFSSYDFFSEKGLKYDFNAYFKNLNTLAKNDLKYKSSLSAQIDSIYNFSTSLPLIKKVNNINEYLKPKLSIRVNPGDMIDNKTQKRLINADNIFDINRLGISDSFEAGKSMTLGIDYKKENLNINNVEKDSITENINDYFEVKLATVFRDTEEEFIPVSSTLNRKNSNIFGSVKRVFNQTSENALIDILDLRYLFSLDNDLNTFEYNSFKGEVTFDNFTTTINFIEENGEIGDSSSIENSISYKSNKNNFFSFSTRRNRKINLTEYYDFLYEYKIDCLTAGIKYKKSYYQDRDLKPTEDLIFSFTFYPLTTYEQEIDQDFYRN